MADSSEIRIVADNASLFQAAAEEFVSQATRAVAAHNRFTVALSGGSTPRGLFSLLATKYRDPLPWDKMFFFWSDERHVPPDNPESNYRMAYEAMLSKVPVPSKNVFRVPAENPDANCAAETYEQTVREFFGLPAGTFPPFDLILLGMGPDGHTASLFPGTAALEEMTRRVLANFVPKFNAWRLTFTFPLINHAREILFLVGESKSPQLIERVLAGDQQFPAARVNPSPGELTWMIAES